MFVLGHLKWKFNCLEIDKSMETDILSGNGMTYDELHGSEIQTRLQLQFQHKRMLFPVLCLYMCVCVQLFVCQFLSTALLSG